MPHAQTRRAGRSILPGWLLVGCFYAVPKAVPTSRRVGRFSVARKLRLRARAVWGRMTARPGFFEPYLEWWTPLTGFVGMAEQTVQRASAWVHKDTFGVLVVAAANRSGFADLTTGEHNPKVRQQFVEVFLSFVAQAIASDVHPHNVRQVLEHAKQMYEGKGPDKNLPNLKRQLKSLLEHADRDHPFDPNKMDEVPTTTFWEQMQEYRRRRHAAEAQKILEVQQDTRKMHEQRALRSEEASKFVDHVHDDDEGRVNFDAVAERLGEEDRVGEEDRSVQSPAATGKRVLSATPAGEPLQKRARQDEQVGPRAKQVAQARDRVFHQVRDMAEQSSARTKDTADRVTRLAVALDTQRQRSADELATLRNEVHDLHAVVTAMHLEMREQLSGLKDLLSMALDGKETV